MNEHPGAETQNAEPEVSEVFLEHALTPHNLGVLPEPAHCGQAQGTCGDFMEMYLRVEQDTIAAVRFLPQGCMHTVACGSVLTCLIQGLTLGKAAAIGPDQVEAQLGGLPREHRHCAALAVACLRAAIRECYQNLRSPWKRLYQRS